MFLPSTFCGMPAFGCADRKISDTDAIFSIASSMILGPIVQLSPATSAPHEASLEANSPGSVP